MNVNAKNVPGLLNAVESAQTQILVEHFQHRAESALPIIQTVLHIKVISSM